MKKIFGTAITVLLAMTLLAACASAQTGNATGGGTGNASPTTAPTTAAQLARELNAMNEGSARASGNTVTLTRGTGVQRDLTIPAGVTLELTGDGGLWLHNNVTLTVNGTVNAPSNTIGFDGGANARAITINGNGTINLTSKGQLINWGGDGNGKKLTLDGVTLVGVPDNDSALVNVGEGAELVMKSGAIRGNTSTSNDYAGGGGVNLWHGTFTMEGGAISGNSALGTRGSSGGGVSIGEGSVFTMSGGTITDNNALANNAHGGGGGAYVNEGGTFILEGGAISGNFAKSDGGGVYVHMGTFTMKGGTISGNITGPDPREGASGGGVLVNGTFTMEGGTISGNTAADEGGGGVGVYRQGTFIMIGGTIYGSNEGNNSNTAPTGAAVMAYGTARWGTGGTYTKGGVNQSGGGNIGNTNDTLIAIPAR